MGRQAYLYIFSLLINFTNSEQRCADHNYHLYEVTAFNVYERSVLQSLQAQNESVMFMNDVTNEAAIPMEVIVNRCCMDTFEDTLRFNNIEYSSVDIGDTSLEQINHYVNDTLMFDKYAHTFLSWDSINQWTDQKLKMYPTLSRKVIATTFEKREIFVLTLSLGRTKPGVLIMSGEQGRDRMSIAVLMNFINKLLQRKRGLGDLIYYYDFYFLPVLNADGYEYAMKDQFWTKNRKAFILQKKCLRESGVLEYAIGVNLDRNWFMNRDVRGRDECTSIYKGHKSLSEEETRGLSEYLDTIAGNMMAFINLRGLNSRLVTIPYGYTKDHSINHDVMMQILTSACDKVYKLYKTTYYYGTTAAYFYNHTGNAGDWVKKLMNIPIVYTVHVKHKEELLPKPGHIEPLTQQFGTIVLETLLIAKDIYGPLFKNVDHVAGGSPLTVIIFVLLNLLLSLS